MEPRFDDLEAILRGLPAPKLPAGWRREILGRATGAPGPVRRVWLAWFRQGALAAAWVLIVGLWWATPDTTPHHPIQTPGSAFADAVRRNREMLAELERPAPCMDADGPVEFRFQLPERQNGTSTGWKVKDRG